MKQPAQISEQLCASMRRVLKEARLEAQLSLNELSKRAGLNRMAISFIEKGERVPSLDTFFRIAAALGIAPASLLEMAQQGIPKTDWKKLGVSLAEQRNK